MPAALSRWTRGQIVEDPSRVTIPSSRMALTRPFFHVGPPFRAAVR